MFSVLLGTLAGLMVVSWGWLGQRLYGGDPLEGGDLGRAAAAFAAGDLDEAVQAARIVYTRAPARSDALLLLVRALIYRGYADYDGAADHQAALDLASEAVRTARPDADRLTAYALALHADGQSLAAYRAAQQALQMRPDHALARVALALAYGGVGGFDNALQEHQRVNAPPEWQVDALRALAISYSDLGRYAEAAATVEAAIGRNDGLLALYFERGLYAVQQGDSDAATQAYFQVLARDPQNAKARLRLCALSSLLRESAAALQYCGQAVEIAPGWAEAWHQLGREYYVQGDFAQAQAHLNRCARLEVRAGMPPAERTFECWYLQGLAAELRGDCPALLATYAEWTSMAALANLPQTWTYPPEGPPGCASP
jgi:tetratricopeptide (TPR) repeat protein